MNRSQFLDREPLASDMETVGWNVGNLPAQVLSDPALANAGELWRTAKEQSFWNLLSPFRLPLNVEKSVGASRVSSPRLLCIAKLNRAGRYAGKCDLFLGFYSLNAARKAKYEHGQEFPE